MSDIEYERVILVTGANRGIGFFIVKKLVEESSSSKTVILLGSRDLQRGHDALIQLNCPSNVHVLQLDMSSSQSIHQSIDQIKQKYGQVDVVINNAGIRTSDITVNAAREIFNTNYYGVKLLNECIVHLMRHNGRIINVSSRVATRILEDASKTIQDKYTSTTLTGDQLDQLVEHFISSIETNTLHNLGYNPQSIDLVYGVSKAALNALTQIEARQWSNTNHLLVVSVTPGLCATDMSRHMSRARSPQLGADSVLYLVNAHRDELENGGFYRDGQRLPFINQSLIKD